MFVCLSRDIHITLCLNKMYLHYLFQVMLYLWHNSLIRHVTIHGINSMWHKFINNRRCSSLCQWYTMERLDVSDETEEPITSPLSLDIPHMSADIRRIWCDKYCKLWNMCELWKILDQDESRYRFYTCKRCHLSVCQMCLEDGRHSRHKRYITVDIVE